jgi:hypothetical protein
MNLELTFKLKELLMVCFLATIIFAIKKRQGEGGEGGLEIKEKGFSSFGR